MDFYALLDQVVDLLQSRQRVTYRTLKRQFDLDDAALEDLKEELLFGHCQVVEAETLIRQASVSPQSSPPFRRPALYP